MTDILHLLSNPIYDCLNFHDVKHLDQSHRDQVAQTVTEMIRPLLEKLEYKHYQAPQNQQLRQELWQWAKDHLLPLVGQEKWDSRLQYALETACQTGEAFYQHNDHDVQFKMARLTLLHVCLDDEDLISRQDRLDLSTVTARLCQRLPQTNAWGTLLVENIGDYSSYFGANDPLVGAIGANGYCAFLDACTLERRLAIQLPPHLTGQGRRHDLGRGHTTSTQLAAAQGFPNYLRRLSAASWEFLVPIFKVSSQVEVPLEYWVSTIPSLDQFIALINDLFSLPKELRAGETQNYVALQTKVHRLQGRESVFAEELWTYRDTIHELTNDALMATQALDQAFLEYGPVESSKSREDDGAYWKLVGDLWKKFKYGYISWHLNTPRYRLDSLADSLSVQD